MVEDTVDNIHLKYVGFVSHSVKIVQHWHVNALLLPQHWGKNNQMINQFSENVQLNESLFILLNGMRPFIRTSEIQVLVFLK